MSRTIESAAILGGGFMGAGIAESAYIAGFPVLIRELPEFTEAARNRLQRSLDLRGETRKARRRQAGCGTGPGHLNQRAQRRRRQRSRRRSRSGEPATEDLDHEELNEIVGSDTILASNTSSIPIAQLGSVVSNPARVLGLHFFSPVPVMKLVEIVRALDISDETGASAQDFVTRLGKHPIETKDRAGFIVNFLLTPYLIGAVRMYEEASRAVRTSTPG